MSPTSAQPRTSRVRTKASAELLLALSPYHLCTREAPAMLALTLGSSVATLLPEPPAGDSREEVKTAAHSAPRFLRLMDSWKWSGPMWNAGVLGGGFAGERTLPHLGGVYEDIQRDAALIPLRALTQQADERRRREPVKALDALCADLLRGGPDPGFNIPVTAALDRLSAACGACVVRSDATSVAQRAELLLGRKLFAFSMPLLLRAGGGRVLLMRRDLQTQLDALRAALHDAVAGVCRDVAVTPVHVQNVQTAARDFGAAFNAWSTTGAVGDDENDQRVVPGYVSVTVVALPPDAALRSGRAAMRAMSASSSSAAFPGAPAGPPLIALMVREMNVRPA